MVILAMPPIEAECEAAQTLAGHYRCGFTDYMWPSGPEDSPTATGSGTIEFEADSNGKFTSGTLSELVADDTRTFGQRACTFQLVSGESRMSSSAGGSSIITWKLNPGGDTHCGAYLGGLPNLGFTESPRDYKTFTTTSQFFMEPSGNSKWVGASAVGVSMGVCTAIP
jgi:hypothetical protein